jgi:hypothetical protein
MKTNTINEGKGDEITFTYGSFYINILLFLSHRKWCDKAIFIGKIAEPIVFRLGIASQYQRR